MRSTLTWCSLQPLCAGAARGAQAAGQQGSRRVAGATLSAGRSPRSVVLLLRPVSRAPEHRVPGRPRQRCHVAAVAADRVVHVVVELFQVAGAAAARAQVGAAPVGHQEAGDGVPEDDGQRADVALPAGATAHAAARAAAAVGGAASRCLGTSDRQQAGSRHAQSPRPAAVVETSAAQSRLQQAELGRRAAQRSAAHAPSSTAGAAGC